MTVKTLSLLVPALIMLGASGCATNTAELKRLSDAVEAAQRSADQATGVAQEALDTAKQARGDVAGASAAARSAQDAAAQAQATANKASQDAAAAQDAASRAEVKAERMFTKSVSK
jgi:hypothetical protein